MKAAVQEGVVVDVHPENGYECHSSIIGELMCCYTTVS